MSKKDKVNVYDLIDEVEGVERKPKGIIMPGFKERFKNPNAITPPAPHSINEKIIETYTKRIEYNNSLIKPFNELVTNKELGIHTYSKFNAKSGNVIVKSFIFTGDNKLRFYNKKVSYTINNAGAGVTDTTNEPYGYMGVGLIVAVSNTLKDHELLKAGNFIQYPIPNANCPIKGKKDITISGAYLQPLAEYTYLTLPTQPDNPDFGWLMFDSYDMYNVFTRSTFLEMYNDKDVKGQFILPF